MISLAQTLQLIFLIALAFADESPKVEPQLRVYQENTRNSVLFPESTVKITVGEKNGFQYTVSGVTQSREKIAVSGEYFNDEASHYGYTRMFLVVESGVAYYALRPYGNRLDVYVQNYNYEEFYFEILSPQPVSAYNLEEGQINATAILVTGPSRSAIF